jgi:outer membrane biogenesis lipoprotein LolB
MTLKILMIAIVFVIIAGCSTSSTQQDHIQKSATWNSTDQQYRATIVFNPDGTGTSDYEKTHTNFKYQYAGGNQYTLTTDNGLVYEMFITDNVVTSTLTPNVRLQRSKL